MIFSECVHHCTWPKQQLKAPLPLFLVFTLYNPPPPPLPTPQFKAHSTAKHCHKQNAETAVAVLSLLPAP